MDDLDAVLDYLTFGPERVYLLVALARSKDNPDADADAVPTTRRIVASREDLRREVAALDHAAARFDARVRLYLSANARDTLTGFFLLRDRMDDWLEMRLRGNEEVVEKFGRVDREFTSVLQSDACATETNFVFDLDDATGAEARAFAERVADHAAVAMVRETPNGYHVVTEAFDYTRFEAAVEYELKTDGLIFCSFVGERSGPTEE